MSAQRGSSPGGGSALLGALREYWAYRELFYFLCWREVKVRYKQTVLGIAWAVLQPACQMVIFTLLFGRLARLPSEGLPYPIFVYSALVPWTYFAGAFTRSGNSLVANANLITKVYFPRDLIPASNSLAGLFDFALASLLLFAMFPFYDVAFGWEMLLWPVLILPLFVLSIGIGLLFSALNVTFRDVRHLIPFLAQLGMFLSPVVYPTSMIPERYRFLMTLNPVSGVIEAYRAAISPERSIDWGGFGVSIAITLVVFAIGFVYFRRTERDFADVI